MTQGKIDHSSGRRSGGKKIDTWTFQHPEVSPIDIDVALVSDAASIRFQATTKAPIASSLTWEHSDIEELRRIVHANIEQLVEQAATTDWRSAFCIETQTQEYIGSNFGLRIEMKVDHLRLDAAQQSRNDGRRRVMQSNRIVELQERSIGDIRPQDTTSGFRIETPKSICVIEEDAMTSARMDDLRATLSRFGHLLARRLGPDQIHKGVPTPSDLVEIMTRATQYREG